MLYNTIKYSLPFIDKFYMLWHTFNSHNNNIKKYGEFYDWEIKKIKMVITFFSNNFILELQLIFKNKELLLLRNNPSECFKCKLY